MKQEPEGSYIDNDNIGEVIRQLRQERGLSIQELASLTEYSYNYINGIETGRYQRISLKCLKRIATALGVEYVELLSPEPSVAEAPEQLTTLTLTQVLALLTSLNDLDLQIVIQKVRELQTLRKRERENGQ